MYRVTFELDAFNGVADAEESIAQLGALLDCLVQIDTIYLLHHSHAPLLYASGVRYEEEPIGADFWRDIPTVLKYGTGDCEDLACWRVAELRVRGISARPIIIPQLRPNGKFLYHIVVAMPDGSTEDPSRRLGMK